MIEYYINFPNNFLMLGGNPRCPKSMLWFLEWRHYDCRAFSIAGPTVGNSLPDELRDPVRYYKASEDFSWGRLFNVTPACGSDSFKQFLKTILYSL